MSALPPKVAVSRTSFRVR